MLVSTTPAVRCPLPERAGAAATGGGITTLGKATSSGTSTRATVPASPETVTFCDQGR